MIRHQTIGEEPNVHAVTRLAQQPDERVEVAVLMKDGTPPIAAIEDVITISTLGSSCAARHAENYLSEPDWLQAKCTLSPFLPRTIQESRDPGG